MDVRRVLIISAYERHYVCTHGASGHTRDGGKSTDLAYMRERVCHTHLHAVTADEGCPLAAVVDANWVVSKEGHEVGVHLKARLQVTFKNQSTPASARRRQSR